MMLKVVNNTAPSFTGENIEVNILHADVKSGGPKEYPRNIDEKKCYHRQHKISESLAPYQICTVPFLYPFCGYC